MSERVHIRFDPDGEGPICYAVDPDRAAESIAYSRRHGSDVHDEADCTHRRTPLPDDTELVSFGARTAAPWLTGSTR